MNDTVDISRERVRVVSLDTDIVDHGSAVERVAGLVRSGAGGYVCFSTVHMVMEAKDSENFGATVNAADMIVADGMPIVWMQKLRHRSGATRVRANDLMMLLCDYAEKHDLKVGFYGGQESVIAAIRERAEREYPRLRLVYAYSPPFRPMTAEEDEQVTSEINASAPGILFVGLGCPKQENWMAEHKGRLTAVMLGVGASFDFFAGNVNESPAWLGRLGLEWLYRLGQEPRRLWRRYLILNPRFIWHSIRQLLSSTRTGA